MTPSTYFLNVTIKNLSKANCPSSCVIPLYRYTGESALRNSPRHYSCTSITSLNNVKNGTSHKDTGFCCRIITEKHCSWLKRSFAVSAGGFQFITMYLFRDDITPQADSIIHQSKLQIQETWMNVVNSIFLVIFCWFRLLLLL